MNNNMKDNTQTNMGINASSSIIEILSGNLMNERLDNILLDDPEYIKILENIDQATVCFESLKLPMNQRMIVDTLIAAYTAYGAYYARMAYQQGMKDCVRMLREIGVL